MCEYQSELQEVSIIFCWPDGSGKLYLFSLLSPIKKGYRSNGGPLLPPLVPPVPASLNLSIGSKAKDSEIVRLAVINILIQQSVWSSHNAIIWHMAWSVVSGFFFWYFRVHWITIHRGLGCSFLPTSAKDEGEGNFLLPLPDRSTCG